MSNYANFSAGPTAATEPHFDIMAATLQDFLDLDTTVQESISNEKVPDGLNVSSVVSEESDEDYDYDDPKNYTTNYIDEYNPKGLRIPTKEEVRTLRRILGSADYRTYLICLCELAERASYYSVSGVLTNFIQRPMPEGSPHGWGAPASKHASASAGALGRGLQAASGLTLLLKFLAYVVPLWGGFIADTKLGRFKAIWIGVIIGFVSHVLFVIAAIPSVISHPNGALGVTAISIVSLALATGLIKPNLLPLLMDQYPEKVDVVKVLKSGEKVIVDRQKSFQRMTLIFYWSINIGAFVQIGTSYIERRVGFWLAFLFPIVLYLVLPVVLFYLERKLVKEIPKGSVLTNSWRIFRTTFKGNWIPRYRSNQLWEYAKPSSMIAKGQTFYNAKKKSPITWDDQWVLDIKQTVNSCKIFFWYPIFFLADGGIGSIETSQAGSMSTKGIPNDLFHNFNPLTIIVLIPILDFLVYPTLRKYRIEFKPVHRIAFGFILAGSSQIAGAIIQHRIYSTSPCGNRATTCKEPSPISAWQEISVYMLAAAGECFALTTAYELAYTRSPPHMKGLVVAIFLFTTAFSAAISQALLPVLKDPYLIWPFASVAVATFIAAGLFAWQFRNLYIEMEHERLLREELDRKKESQIEGGDEENDLPHGHGGIEDDKNLVAVTSIKSAAGK